LAGEDDDPAALYGSEHMAIGQPAWYSIDGYSYGINDWRGNAVAEHQLQRRPNDIPLHDVISQTGNGSAVDVDTIAVTTTTTVTSSRLVQLLHVRFGFVPYTHRRRRRDSTVQLSRVGVN